jgi:hypothetical protein
LYNHCGLITDYRSYVRSAFSNLLPPFCVRQSLDDRLTFT